MTEHRKIEDVLKPKPFYPDLPKTPKDDIVGIPVILHDWTIVKGWNSQEYGNSTFALIAYSVTLDSTGPEFTTLISGLTVIKKLSELQHRGLKGIEATLVKQETKAGNEMWNLI